MGVGLVYKPHYISTESFCSAFMHLSMWHTVASSEDSTDKLDSVCLILVSISEMSEVVPVVQPHPIFLDVAGKEVMEKTVAPLAPHWFQGFRLHTVWSRPPGEEPVHQITFLLASGGRSPHPCWSTSRKSFLTACSRGPRLQYLSGPLPVCTGT